MVLNIFGIIAACFGAYLTFCVNERNVDTLKIGKDVEKAVKRAKAYGAIFFMLSVLLLVIY